MDRNATINFLEDQFHDLQLDLDDAQAQLHQMQVDPPTPPSPMQVDGGEEEPQEIQGVSEMDFEDQVPQPAPVEAHTPVASEASVNI